MSRHLDNLDRLCKKLSCRYGEHDRLALQIKTEFEACKGAEKSVLGAHDWAVTYRSLVADRNSEFMQSIYS